MIFCDTDTDSRRYLHIKNRRVNPPDIMAKDKGCRVVGR